MENSHIPHSQHASPQSNNNASPASNQLASNEYGFAPNLAAPRQLKVSELCLKAKTKELPASTRRIKPINDFVGQARAKAAMLTALNIHASGYNVFASGRNGLGKRTMIMRLLTAHAKTLPTPSDWVYVNNFSYSRKPVAISFKAGDAKAFKTQMYALWEQMIAELKVRFRADRYLTQVDVIREKIGQEQQSAYHELTEEGKQLNLQLVNEDDGHHFVPIDPPFDDSQYVSLEKEASTTKETSDTNKKASNAPPPTAKQPTNQPASQSSNQSSENKMLLPQALQRQQGGVVTSLTEKTDLTKTSAANPSKAELKKNQRYMQRKLKELSHKLENLEVAANKEIDELNTQITQDVLKPLLKPIFTQFKHNAAATDYLEKFQTDVIDNVEAILREEGDDFMAGLFEPIPLRYQINIMESHEPNAGAPVVFEDMPTHYNLIGHVEQVTHMGTVTTDFSLIRSGALHKANGGFLVLEALSLLEQPYAWQGIKRALQSKSIKLSSLEQMITLTGSISLEPDVIPLQVKVILLGEPALYYELLELEPEFDSLFKIRADFSDTMPRTPENEATYVQMIADYVRVHQLLPFDRSALAALLEHASKQAEEQQELSLHAGMLGQMLLEANSMAASQSAKAVSSTHIAETLDARYYRMGYLRELYWHDLARGFQLISTSGTSVGQINALTVIQYADSEFGLPARLTATAHQGNGEIIDVERDVNLAGNLHAKGMMIMSSYLRALFGQKHVLSFTAALTFEQNYGQIDGDSATLAEACALISSLADMGIDQSWAITGSMNQFGDVQPIGGINAKIEGFYDTCKLQGLTGSQGVIIPIQNQAQLMLRDDVIASVKKGEFHVYAISHVSHALEKLLGKKCGKLNKKGKYSKGSIYAAVMARLKEWQDDDDDSDKNDKNEADSENSKQETKKKKSKK